MWRIPELTLMILELLRRRDQASMASVSRWFWQIATPLVWASLSDVKRQTHLLRILPPGLEELLKENCGCSSNDTQLLEAFADHERWSRFNIHAPLVKSFDLELGHDQDNLAQVFTAFHRLNMAPTFPNLRTLYITLYPPQPLGQILPAILCPSIRILRLEMLDDSYGWDDTTVPQLLAATKRLSLDELEIRTLLDDEQTVSAIADAITAQPALLRLHLYDSAARMLRPWVAASSLAYLREASFMASYPYDNPLDPLILESPVSGTRGFPNLGTLRVDGRAIEIATAIAAIGSDLEMMEIMVYPPPQDDPEPLSDLAGVMKEVSRFTHIKSFEITFPASTAIWTDFAPLLSCRGMRECSLFGYGLSRMVGDAEVLLMARAWPELETLVIEDFVRREEFDSRKASAIARLDPHYQVVSPKATLGGLGCLAVHTPCLRKLSIAVDARATSSRLDNVVIGASVSDLALPYSWTDNTSADAVASFICRTWPNQTLLTEKSHVIWTAIGFTAVEYDGRGGTMYGPWFSIWGKVYSALMEERFGS